MTSKYIYLIIICLLLYSLSQFTGYSTIVFPISKYKFQPHKSPQRGQIVNPLSDFDFGNGKWTVYLEISPSDFRNLNPLVTKATCLKTSDIQLLREMKKNWNFRYSGGDVATVNSTIYFVKNGRLVFESGIVIDKNMEGLQGEEYGWLEPIGKKALSKSASRFNRVYLPVIFI